MSRTARTAREAGTRFETLVARYLAEHCDDRIERRTRNGAKDRGDLSGVRTPHGGRVVLEVKNYGGQIKAAQWMAEAHVEMGNDDASVAAVIAKRRGTNSPGDQWVLMTLSDLVSLLTGDRPE